MLTAPQITWINHIFLPKLCGFPLIIWQNLDKNFASAGLEIHLFHYKWRQMALLSFFRFPLGRNTFLQASLATKCTKLQWKNKAHKVGNIAHFKAEKFIWKLARNMVLVSSKVRFLVKKGDWVRFLSFFPILWTRYLKNPKITSFTRKVNESGYF